MAAAAAQAAAAVAVCSNEMPLASSIKSWAKFHLSREVIAATCTAAAAGAAASAQSNSLCFDGSWHHFTAAIARREFDSSPHERATTRLSHFFYFYFYLLLFGEFAAPTKQSCEVQQQQRRRQPRSEPKSRKSKSKTNQDETGTPLMIVIGRRKLSWSLRAA